MRNLQKSNSNTTELFLQQFLAVAIQGSGINNSETQSKIFRWKEKDRKFVLHQLITTYSAKSLKSFKIDGRTYLAVANYMKGLIKFIAINCIKFDKSIDVKKT